MAGMARAIGATLMGGRKKCLAKIEILMHSFLNFFFAPHVRDGKRLDGARDNKQVRGLAPPCSNLKSFGRNVGLMDWGLVGPFRRPTQWLCAPIGDSGPGNFFRPWPPHYAPVPCIHKLQSCINTASLPKALSWACYASTTKHYDKTVVLWHAITRGSDIVTEQERSLAISTSPRPSHAIRKDTSVRTAAFQARRYKSESGWDEFKSMVVAVRIWLLRK